MFHLIFMVKVIYTHGEIIVHYIEAISHPLIHMMSV